MQNYLIDFFTKWCYLMLGDLLAGFFASCVNADEECAFIKIKYELYHSKLRI